MLTEELFLILIEIITIPLIGGALIWVGIQQIKKGYAPFYFHKPEIHTWVPYRYTGIANILQSTLLILIGIGCIVLAGLLAFGPKPLDTWLIEKVKNEPELIASICICLGIVLMMTGVMAWIGPHPEETQAFEVEDNHRIWGVLILILSVLTTLIGIINPFSR